MINNNGLFYVLSKSKKPFIGTTINSNEETIIAIQNPNGDYELKLPNDIGKQ